MSEPNLVAWSYSRLNAYETCPRKFWNESVAKVYPFVPTDASSYGDDVHKAFKLYFRNGEALPLHLRQYDAQLKIIKAAPGQRIVEQQIALNAKWQQVEWYAKDAWLRVISDLTQHNGKRAVTWDWKTGRPSEDFTQLRINAAVTFLLAPEIETITMAYFWLKTKEVAPMDIKRADASDVWANILPRVQRYQEAHDQKDFPPRQNFLCRGYCPVKTCQFWEAKR